METDKVFGWIDIDYYQQVVSFGNGRGWVAIHRHTSGAVLCHCDLECNYTFSFIQD